jgi:small nuclear ribonucleoprotein (snRNP)-like protein
MRWDELFADLGAQVEARQIAERSTEIEDRTRYEFGQLTLVDRLRSAIGGQVRIRCAGGVTMGGRLDRAHPEWLLLIEPTGREALVAGTAVRSVGGLGPWSAAAGGQSAVEARLGLRYALRTIARDRSAVRIHLRDGEALDGTLDRIGADFAELAEHPPGEFRRRAEVTGFVTVPFSAIVAVRRDG